MKSLTHRREFFPPTAEDLPSSEPTKEALPTADPNTSSLPLDTQAASLVAAAEKSANKEEPDTKKLKVTNPDIEPDDWEKVENPEELGVESAAEKDMAKSGLTAGKIVGEPISDIVEEQRTTEKKESVEDANLGKNSLLKDW